MNNEGFFLRDEVSYETIGVVKNIRENVEKGYTEAEVEVTWLDVNGPVVYSFWVPARHLYRISYPTP